jgi:hypothetical protein
MRTEYKEIVDTAVKIYFSNNISAKEAIEKAKNIWRTKS